MLKEITKMKKLLLLGALILAACSPAAPGEGGAGGAGPSASLETKTGALGVTVGTHRVTGSYTCRVSASSSITWSVSSYVYIAQSNVGVHNWKIQLNHDDTAQGVSLANHQVAPTEAVDNGAVVYTTADTSVYVHKTPGIWGYEYSHDEDTPPTEVQFYPHVAGDTLHPLGQLVVTMYPQGASDTNWGECATPVTAYLTLQP